MSLSETLLLVLFAIGMIAALFAAVVLGEWLIWSDETPDLSISRTVTNYRKRRASAQPMIMVQTYFILTEAPFGQAIDLAYGVKVAIPAKYRKLALGSFTHDRGTFARTSEDFHSLIQLPGAFIVR